MSVDKKTDRAKTEMQLKRNSALRDAEKKLKALPANKGKKISIVWQKTDTKDRSREVTVNDVSAFIQTPEDMSGIFLSPFSDLSF